MYRPLEISQEAIVPNSTDCIQVVASADDGVGIMVNGQAVENGKPSQNIPLEIGENTVTVSIESLDGKKVYTLIITRQNISEILKEAQTAAEPAIKALTPSNALTAEDVLSAVTAAVDHTEITAVWSRAYTLEPATPQTEGQITGEIILSYKENSVKVSVSLTIPVLIPGDLDADGNVTIADVMEACKVLARKSADQAPSAEERAQGDLDGDGDVTIADVMEICKILARGA